MFRLLAWLIGLTLGTLTVAAFLLLTETGNGLLRPLVEQVLQTKLPKAKVTLLDIRPDHANLSVQLSPESQLLFNAKTALLEGKATGTWQLVSKDLTQLQAILSTPLAGAASSEGHFDTSFAQQEATGKISLTLSQIDFTLNHTKETPATLNAHGKLYLSEVAQLLQQPSLASGKLQLVAQLKLDDWHDKQSLNGTIGCNITDGMILAQAVREKTTIALLNNTPFTLNTTTDVLNGKTLSQILLNSPLATLGLNNLRYNLGEDGLSSDHQTNINDLSKLSFLTGLPLHGRMQINGKLSYTLPTHHVIADASSQTLGGKITAKLNGDQLNAQLIDLQATELSAMLGMPVVFKSNIKGDLVYDLGKQVGKFDANLYDGQILPNEFSVLLNSAAKFDITREVYEQVHTDGRLNAGNVTANLEMQSHLTHLSAKDAQINLKQHLINATLLAQVKGFTIPVRIQGDLSSPKVSSELTSTLTKQAEQAATETIEQEKQNLANKIKQQLNLPNFGH
jgi:hypothetical protein